MKLQLSKAEWKYIMRLINEHVKVISFIKDYLYTTEQEQQEIKRDFEVSKTISEKVIKERVKEINNGK